MNDTQVRVSQETKEGLKKLKIAKRESYDEIIQRLIEHEKTRKN